MSFTNAYSFNDVLIKPRLTNVISRKLISLKSHLTPNISLNLPLIAANMDTICEDKMAIAMALAGGIGFIHRYCSIDDQSEMVKRVKRFVNRRIENPYRVTPETTINVVKELMAKHKVSSILVVRKKHTLLGIITRRDIEYAEYNTIDDIVYAENIMTPLNRLIVGSHSDSDYNLEQMMLKKRLEKLPLVDEVGRVKALITLRDITYYKKFKDISTLDEHNRLRCGAAIGVNGDYLERAKALVNAGVDVLVIDIAHGHSESCGKVIREIKELYPIEIIAGNVATAEGTKFLIEAGADAIKVNIGAGSICKTRETTGCGVPQLSAVLDAVRGSRSCSGGSIPIISDGGNCGKIGNIFKALAAGASTVMLGNFLAGTDETPGAVVVKGGKKMKMIRGMAGYMSNAAKTDKMCNNTTSSTIVVEDMCPEGVEGYIPYKGDVLSILKQIQKGVCSGMSYVGCHKVSELHNTPIEYVKLTASGQHESGIHSINEI
jgi:IMP dehydrogenase